MMVMRLPELALWLGAWVAISPLQPAAERQTLEYEVKAAYLLNFLSLVEAPGDAVSATNPLRVCVASRDPFGPAIDRVMQGEQVGGRQVVVERLVGSDGAEQCALLFVPAGANPEVWLPRAGARTLTVGETRDFVRRGGIIELAVDAGRVRFDVNLGVAEARKLRLSSRLLRLARTTIRGPE